MCLLLFQSCQVVSIVSPRLLMYVFMYVCVCVAQPAALFLILPAPLSHDPGGAVHTQGEAAGGGDHVSSCRLPRPDSRPAPLPAPPEAGTHKLELIYPHLPHWYFETSELSFYRPTACECLLLVSDLVHFWSRVYCDWSVCSWS